MYGYLYIKYFMVWHFLAVLKKYLYPLPAGHRLFLIYLSFVVLRSQNLAGNLHMLKAPIMLYIKLETCRVTRAA